MESPNKDRLNLRVLIVTESDRDFAVHRSFFTRYDCECVRVRTQWALREVCDLSQMDIVFCAHGIRGASIQELIGLFLGSRASVFCSLRVEAGHLWFPALRFGNPCWGTAVFRGAEVAEAVDQLVGEIGSRLQASRSKASGLHRLAGPRIKRLRFATPKDVPEEM